MYTQGRSRSLLNITQQPGRVARSHASATLLPAFSVCLALSRHSMATAGVGREVPNHNDFKLSSLVVTNMVFRHECHTSQVFINFSAIGPFFEGSVFRDVTHALIVLEANNTKIILFDSA